MPNAQLYALVISTVGGICLFPLITAHYFFAVFLCLICMCFVWLMFGARFLKKSTKFFILICLCGFITGLVRTEIWLSFNHVGVLDELVNKKVSINGLVIEEPQVSDLSSKIIIETEVEARSGQRQAKVLVTSDRYTEVKYGDEIKLFGKIMVPKPIENPDGDFAYDVYLARQGIFYTLTFPTITITARHRGNVAREFLINLKNNFLAKVDSLFPSPRSGLLAGLLVSGRSSLSKAEQVMFTQAGLIHIVALSGFNVTIIAQGLMILLAFLPKKLRLLIGGSGIIAFVIMTGFGATVVRAGIMALLVIMAALMYRTYNVGRALFVAVLCMALYDPMLIYNVSFQLSCLATFAVIFAVPLALAKYELRFKFLPEKFKIRETMIGTAVIEIFLLPILLYTSGQISLVTVITNLLVLPVLPVVMGFGFLTTLLGYVNSFAAMILLAISNTMLGYILFIANFFASIPFVVISTKLPGWAVIVFYLALALWFYKLQTYKTKGEQLQKTVGSLSSGMSGYALTSENLERHENFLRSHSS